MQIEKTDVLVIGAGPSGTVAAALVKKHGLNAVIVEKQKFPRFVIGESLLPRCMVNLEEAGLLDAVKTKGFQKKFGAKFLKGDKECDINFAEQFTEGWKWTWQVPRADFDKALADEVEKKGVPIYYENAVVNVQVKGTDSLTTIEERSGAKRQVAAKFIIDASGYGRVLPKLFNLDKPSGFPSRKTIFAHFKDAKRLEGIDGTRITIIALHTDVWVWVIPFSNGNTSLGFVGNNWYFDRFEGSNEKQFREMVEEVTQIKDNFRDTELVFEPHRIEGYSISVKQFYGDGYALTGNSSEFLDPVFSSGVAFATESGTVAAKLACRQIKGEKVDWEKDFTQHMKQGVDTFRSYVTGWYDGTLQDIFFSPKVDINIKKQITSVLAGYVWDMNNPFVSSHSRVISTLAHFIKMESGI
jgi:flavin-dependent dehydrogenase